MSNYITLAALEADIPLAFAAQALDDLGDGDITARFAIIQDAVAVKIHGFLSQRFVVPFVDPVPPIVSRAAYVFALDTLHRRRGMKGEDNPWEEEEEKFCKILEAIGAGKTPLIAGLEKKTASVVVVTEPARTTSRSNHLST